jgi:prepilin-type N-terminal cleavage/methylation domain-containing protein
LPTAGSKGQRGVTLLETLVAAAVLGVAGVVFMAGMGTAQLTGSHIADQATAVRLAGSQVEHAKGLPYQSPPASYETIDCEAPYSLECTSQALDDGNKSKLVVTVKRNGQALLTVEDYKVNR